MLILLCACGSASESKAKHQLWRSHDAANGWPALRGVGVRGLVFILLAVWLVDALPGGAAEPEFPIRAYRLEGNSLLPTAQIEQALVPLLGAGKTFDTLRRAVEAVEALYAEAGYSAVRVLLPEQDVTEGEVRLKVIEAKVGQVLIHGNLHHSDANIRASVPDLVEGLPPPMEQVGASLALANESFAKRARLTLQKGKDIGEVDAHLRVADEKPWRFAVSLDNTGDTATGRTRLGLIAQHANLFDRDQSISAQAITSPGHERDVSIIGLGYKIPLYTLGDSIEIAYGNSNVDSGSISTAAGDFGISGRGEFASLRYNLGLPRWNGNEQKLVIEAGWKTFESQVVPAGGGTSLIPDLSAAPFSLGYSTGSPEGALTWRAGISHVWNLGSGGNGTTTAYNQAGARPGADAGFMLWRWNLSASYTFAGDWHLNATANGQETDDLLISGEQFGMGGMDSIRGYKEREILNDLGWRAGVELSAPQRAISLAEQEASIRAVVFHEAGSVSRNRTLAGENRHRHAASIGVGTRLGIGKQTQLRADLAQALEDGATTRAGEWRGHAQLIVLFK